MVKLKLCKDKNHYEQTVIFTKFLFIKTSYLKQKTYFCAIIIIHGNLEK